MFNLGFSELLLLGVIALIFIGPQQLPELARTLGRMLNEFKRATSDFQSTMTDSLKEDVKKDLKKDVKEQIKSAPEERPPGDSHES